MDELYKIVFLPHIYRGIYVCTNKLYTHKNNKIKSAQHLYSVNFLCIAGNKLCTTRICRNYLKLCPQLFTLGSSHFQRKKLTFRKVKVTLGLERGGVRAGVRGREREHCGWCAKQIKNIKQKTKKVQRTLSGLQLVRLRKCGTGEIWMTETPILFLSIMLE